MLASVKTSYKSSIQSWKTLIIRIEFKMGKKGLSLEEKRQKILEIYLERKEVFNLKEIEKIGSQKGVVFQTIKDVN